MKRDFRIFLSSVFFVLGFSIIFSLVGVLLQTVLLNVSYVAQQWFARIGGIIIIIFGLNLLGLLKIPFLEKEHKLQVKTRFKSAYLTSFLFGAAFAVGWTPCVGPALGVILTLASTNPSSAFFLLLSYSLGLGVPFIIVGLFLNQAEAIIQKAGKWLIYFQRIFGIILIILGIFVFTSQLGRIANLEFVTNFLLSLNLGVPDVSSTINLSIAFIAGLASFLSPCVLPLIPAYLTYLASAVVKK